MLVETEPRFARSVGDPFDGVGVSYGAVVWVADVSVDENTGETCTVPLLHALIPVGTETTANVVSVGGVISTWPAVEQAGLAETTSLYPRLKYAV
jgi:hypothetical protein